MKFILCLLLLLGHALTLIYNKLSTQFSNSLTSSDYLVSTLGYLRVTLNPQTCQLQIENFTNNNYQIIGYYPRNSLPSCKSLSLVNNSLVSNNNNSLLSLKAADIKSVYDQIFVTIDEMGIIRINGISNKRFESSSQNWISIFRNPQPYIYSISNLIVNLYSSLSFIQNTGNWGFSATNGVVRIFRINNVSKIIRYNYTGFTIAPNNLYDYNTNALPQADFNQFRYYPMCSNRNYLQNFQGPFIFTINPYWPELRLLDRTGYQIISLRYPSPQCIQMLGVDYIQEIDSCTSWFCPSNTFQLNGDCLAICPTPYFHQIGKNGINRCILNCPESFNKDSMRRICACSQLINFECPAELVSTPFGCLCKGNSYFNPHNTKYSPKNNYCYPSCGPFLFPHKSGICVPCPRYCQICSLSSDSYAYLTCSYCTEGYLVNSEGFCIKQAANNTSISCSKIQYCLTCSQSGNNCSSCQKPYSLYNNTCITQCPKGFKSQFDRQKGFTCVVVPVCSSNSAIATSVNNQSKCFCFKNGNPSFARGCIPTKSSTCSLSNYFDSSTLECLLCPIGCLTCIQDSTSRVQCTSCEPDYSLFITVSRNNYCQRNSIISICPNSYQSNTQICQLTTINQVIGTIKIRSDCLDKVSDCMMCVSGSSLQCSVCNTDFFLYQGLCFQSCPNNTVPYRFQRVCLPITKNHCLSQGTESAYWLFTKTFTNQNSQGYLYLLSANFQNVNYLNDPLGSLFIYLRNNQIQNKTKLVNIAISFQKCLICEQGYGITADSSCQKCIFPCISCSLTSNKQSFCLKCDPYFRLNSQNKCEMLKVTELPCSSGQFRNESKMCQRDCLTFQRSNKLIVQDSKTYQINCTVNCPNNYAVSPYQSQNQVRLKCEQSPQNKQSIRALTFLGSKHTLSSGSLYVLASYNQLTYIKSPSIEVELLTTSASRRVLSQDSDSLSYHTTSFGIIVVDSSDSFKNSALLVKLYPANIASSFHGQQIYTSNSIYGFDKETKEFMNIIQNQTQNLYFYGRTFTVLLFILTIIFLSNDINYKTDNIFTTFSVIYLILPSLNLQPQNSLLNCYSLLYGFSWSSFLQFISNPRFVTRTTNWFDNYIQLSNNNAHLLLYIDNNILRNCWSVFLTLIISVGVLGIVSIIMRCFSVYKIKNATKSAPNNCLRNLLYNWSKVGQNDLDFDHSKKVNNFLIFIVQNSIISLTYYSLVNILNTTWQLAPTQKHVMFKIISIALASTILIYSCLRIHANRIAGIYCFKRMGLGLSLGLVTHLGGIDKNIALGISLMIAIQIVFLLLRYKFEFVTNYLSQFIFKQRQIRLTSTRIRTRHTVGGQSPTRSTNPSGQAPPSRQQLLQTSEAVHFWTMVIEQMLIIIIYIFGMLINTLGQASALIVWIIVNVFMINFGVEFIDVVIDYWSNTYNRRNKDRQKMFKKIRNNWDHQLSQKSQSASTNI